MILIVSIQDDLHAMAVQRRLAERGYKDCFILECDRISSSHSLRWLSDPCPSNGCIRLEDGTTIEVSSIDVIWWRRVRADQESLDPTLGNHEFDLINNDCRGALAGILNASFQGTWVSSPTSTDLAADKIYQLSVAEKCGFRIPRTLVSQSISDVKEFAQNLNDRMIVKPVVGAAGPLIFTQFLDKPDELDPSSFELCPAMYQEYIPGTTHVRLNCFGDKSFAATIETQELDWRPNLNIPIKAWVVPGFLHRRVRDVLDYLGLAMGIIDLKQTPDGEMVWLEVNPQGQFLFLEPLTNTPLTDYFCDYLLSIEHSKKSISNSAMN